MFLYFVVTFIYIASGVLSFSIPLSPCKQTDVTCMEKNANKLIPVFMSENSELKIKSSDPLFVEKIEGDLSILKFTFYNTTHTGFKSCVLSNLKLSQDLTKAHCELLCPKITMKGKYEISGRLIILPVEGSGDYTLFTGKYKVAVDSELKKVKGENGKTHLAIKNYKLTSTPLEPMYFDFANLFNGQKDLSDTVHKFAHENWKEVADLVQDPILYACVKKVASSVNKHLKEIAIEEVILQ